MASPSSSKSRVSPEVAEKAVGSLLRWMQKQAKQRKAQLLEHDDLIHLVLSMKKIPSHGRTNPYLIPLPHPLHPLDGSAAVCLFADDRPSTAVAPAVAEERIRAEGIPISEVITLSSLRDDYRPYEARRRLCGSYDLFLADRKILPLLPRLLGKHFFKKKKQPLPVDLSHKGWKEQLRRCLSSATLYLRTGTCCQLNVGMLSQGRDEIVANVMTAIEGAVERIPKKWANVRALHIKSDESVALPIYQAVPEMRFKISTGLEKKVESVEEKGVGPADGEVIQKGEEEEEHEKKEKGKKSSVKKVPKKGRIREVRYMDTNLDDEDLPSLLPGEDGSQDGGGEGNAGQEEEREKKKKKTKDIEVVKADAKTSAEAGLVVDRMKKRKAKLKKSDDLEVKTKSHKKSKTRSELD